MNKNPFLNHNNEEGSLPERMHIRHALYADKGKLPDVDAEWEKLSARIDAREQRKPASVSGGKRLRMVAAWCSVAAVAVCIVGFLMFILGDSSKRVQSVEIYIASAPETPEILLTTTSGTRQTISKLKKSISLDAPAKVAEMTDTMMLQTAPGQEILAVLPDSTRVWLWANSRIEFPAQFSGAERCVKIVGEAYFDVATDSVHPFHIVTPYLDTRVYGTEFALRAFSASDAAVVLLDGSLAVSRPGEMTEKILRPGQQALYAGARGIDIRDVDVWPWIQRRDGMFYFEDEPLFDILLELGRWYNISIISYNDEALSRRVHFVMDRAENPRDVVSELDRILDVDVVYEGNQIAVY